MDSNGKALQELVKFVEEQRRANERYDRLFEEQRRANERYDRLFEEHREEHRRTGEEYRQERKATEQRWQKMFLDHEKWMRTHEVRLGSQYKLIREMRDKLR